MLELKDILEYLKGLGLKEKIGVAGSSGRVRIPT